MTNTNSPRARFVSCVCLAALIGALQDAGAAPEQLFASDADSNDWFGSSLAFGNGRLFIGARQDDGGAANAGAAYVFTDNGSGQWIERQKLLSSVPIAGSNFGTSVSVSGDRLAVAAPSFDGGGPGAAYIFERATDTDIWSQTATVSITESAAREKAHSWVSLDADRLLVADELDDDSAMDSGAAYVFERNSGGNWIQQAKLKSPSPEVGNKMSSYLLLSGDSAFVASLYDDAPSGPVDAGSVEFFKRQGNGSWLHSQTIVASDPSANANFGTSLAILNGLLLIGASGDNSGAGAVYVFEEVAGVYQQVQKILANDTSAGSGFGASVSPSGSSLLIGARFADISPFADAGAVYLFNLNTGGSWQQAAKISNPEPFTNDQFGRYVVLDGSTAFIGTFLDDEPVAGAGSVYVYTDLPVGQEAALAVTSVVQNEAGVVQINYNLTPHDPPPANGYAIRVLAYPTSQDCEATSGIPDQDFDDISAIVSGDTTMSSTGGQGTILWDIRAMDNGPIRQKYYVANGSALFRVFADPVN